MKKQWPYFFLAFAIPTLLVLWWWGLFASADITVATTAAQHYAYVEARGAYSGLAAKQREVGIALRRQGILPGAEFTLILDDPRSTPRQQLQARTGYLIGPADVPLPPIQMDTIPARKALISSVRAHPLLAYGKAYGALLDYSRQHGLTLRLPTVERYRDSVLTVEMPLEAP